MRLNDKNGVKYFTFDSFTDTGLVSHCFSSRVGGVSAGQYQSLNLALNRDDKRENVLENYRRLGQCVGFDCNNLIFSSQVHDTKIFVATEDNLGSGMKSNIEGYDGFVTDTRGLVLTIFTADCVPLFFLDPVKKAIGLSHSGWRGTVNAMAMETVSQMEKLYGSRPSDILAGIGPSICKDCFQVDAPVAEEFLQKIPNAGSLVERRGHKYHIDLWGVNKYFMLKAGLKPDNIELPEFCTKCNPDLFYSHRLSGFDRGSMAAFIALTKD